MVKILKVKTKSNPNFLWSLSVEEPSTVNTPFYEIDASQKSSIY